MASPILLGNTPMCAHGLGATGSNANNYIVSAQTGWGAGTRVGLLANDINVTNPSGAYVWGRHTWSCWSTIGGSLLQGSVSVDGGAQSVWGLFYFNRTGWRVIMAFMFRVGKLPVGSHNINAGVWIAAGNMYMDQYCGGSLLLYETP